MDKDWLLRSPAGIAILSQGVVKLLPTNAAVAFLGTSRTFNAFDVNTGKFYKESRGPGNWAQAQSGNRFTIARTQYGVGGDTSTDIVNRLDPVLADTASIIVFEGFVNDPGGGLSLDTSQGNFRTVAQRTRTANKILIVSNEMPRNGLVGAQLAQHVAMHNWFNLQGALYPHVYIWDTWTPTVDPTTIGTTYQWLVGLVNPDGIHPSGIGCQKMGTDPTSGLVNIINALLPAARYDTPWVFGESPTFPALNLNPGMTGTSGTKGAVGSVTGSIATSWRGDFATGDTSAVCVCSKEAIDANNDFQVFTFSGTSGATATFTLRPLADLTLDGNPVDMRARIVLADGATNVISAYAQARSSGSANQFSRAIDGYQSPEFLTTGFDLPFWSPSCAEAPTPTLKRGEVVVQFNPSSAIAGVVKVATAAARRTA